MHMEALKAPIRAFPFKSFSTTMTWHFPPPPAISPHSIFLNENARIHINLLEQITKLK